MFNDEHKPPSAEAGAETPPGPGGPWRKETLREQVMEVTHHVLSDPCPERKWARDQLRELMAAHPDDP